MIKYFIYPGEVRSKSDGDIHYINGEQLIRLYNLNPSECKTILQSKDERGYDLSKITILRPRSDGNYTNPNGDKR